MIRFRLLGDVEARFAGEPVSLPDGRIRTVLAALLLHANQMLTIPQLIEAVWIEPPYPPRGESELLSHLASLESMLRRVRRTTHGYVMDVGLGELDVTEFMHAATSGSTALSSEDPARAAILLRDALAWWRGPALANAPLDGGLLSEVTYLNQRRYQAKEQLARAQLELSQYAEAIPDLEKLVGEQPVREEPRAMLMLALRRTGRRSEALDHYREFHQLLVDRLGGSPTTQMQEFHREINLGGVPSGVAALPHAGVSPLGASNLSIAVDLKSFGGVRHWTLTGYPVGGTHPFLRWAWTTLHEFEAPFSQDGEGYLDVALDYPGSARISGVWHGVPVFKDLSRGITWDNGLWWRLKPVLDPAGKLPYGKHGFGSHHSSIQRAQRKTRRPKPESLPPIFDCQQCRGDT